ncbi:hypothetical protein QTO34_004541 [Cnephaeus nilssonii]|uniref:Reelin n=1 Tax=Cnephaeus nilssonii TaxID=3371016 RepID=A0AA40LJX6_CNENI|nr:hypothetical protein QTO34_004541 [Eptesicus nilssonii]
MDLDPSCAVWRCPPHCLPCRWTGTLWVVSGAAFRASSTSDGPVPPKQAMINVGCSTDSSSAEPIKLEFSRDFGATWHLLLPLCYHSSGHVSSLCPLSTTRAAPTTQGPPRAGGERLCTSGSCTFAGSVTPSRNALVQHRHKMATTRWLCTQQRQGLVATLR